MVLPGRIPGYKSADIQLLPSNTTKRHVWELYQEAATEFHETCRLLHLHRVVEATLAVHRRHEADD